MTGGQYCKTTWQLSGVKWLLVMHTDFWFEAMAVIGVPTMTKLKYLLYQRNGTSRKWWWKLLQELMQVADEEETHIAIASNEMCLSVTVIVDVG